MFAFHAVLAAVTTARDISCPQVPVIGGACKDISGAVGAVGGAVDTATDTLGKIGHIVDPVFKFFTDFTGWLKDWILWLVQMIFPPELQTWFFGTVGMVPLHDGKILALDANNPNDVYHNLYASMVSPGLAIAACASGARILRTLLDPRSTSMNVVVDVLVRFFVVLVVLVPIGGVSLGYLVMAWSYDAVQAFSVDIAGHILAAALFKGAPAGSSIIEKIFFGLQNTPSVGATFLIGFLFWFIFLLYALVMLIVRTILLGFCVAMAPLCVATAAFDTRNKFFAWWLDIFTGSLAIAPILTLSFWISFSLAASVIAGIPPIGAIIAIIIMIGSIWMAGKLIHQLTWKHFSHGGAIGAFGAAFGVLALAGKGGQVGGLTKLGDHPTMGPILKQMAALGYAGSGFYPEARGGHGSILDGGAAKAAVAGRGQQNGQVSGGGTATDAAGKQHNVASPGEVLRNAGIEAPEGDDGDLGYAVGAYINAPENDGLVGQQFASEGLSQAQVAGMSPQDRAQRFWNSLSTSKEGVETQASIAHHAYSTMLGAASPRGAGAGAGAGTGGGPGLGGGGGGGAGGAAAQGQGATAGALALGNPIYQPGFFGAPAEEDTE